MRRRGLPVLIIAVVAAALFGTWSLAYRMGESDGRSKVSTDRSAFQTRIAAAPQTSAGASGQTGGAPGAANGANGTRGPAGSSAAGAPGGGGPAAGGASGTPGAAGRGNGAPTSNLVGKVTKVDGSTLSVQQTDNSMVSVTTSADTAIRKLVAGALSDL